MMAIRVFQVSKSYRYFQALREISFEVPPGSCYTLFGPNGAGKTTLLTILATLQRPSSGTIEILGHDGVKAREKIRPALFYVAHGSYLYDELDARENLRFALALYGKRVADRELKEALDRVGIGAFSDLRTRFYSAGMKKRLAVAKGILIRPKVLLLDEPYSSLDESGMAMVNDAIRELIDGGTAVFMATHNRTRSAEVANQAGLLRKGKLCPLGLEQLSGAHVIF